MCDIRPQFRQPLAPYAPPTALHQFVVKIRTGAKPEELDVLSASSGDAIVKVIELFCADDSFVPPEGLVVCARPNLPLLRSA